jgi:hypothetical protein
VDGVIKMKTKKRVPEIIRKKMAALLRVDENYSAHFLKHEIEKDLKKEERKIYNFTERTYSTMKNKLKADNRIEKELDEQWSIGDCERYNIPDNMIPIIMEKKKILAIAYDIIDSSGPPNPHDDGGWLEIEKAPMTIRVARWMSRLKPSVDTLIEKFKNDGLDIENRRDNASPEEIIRQKESFLFWLLYNIAQVYAKLEGISEFLGDEHFDSRVTDESFFMKDYKNYGELAIELEIDDLKLPQNLTSKRMDIKELVATKLADEKRRSKFQKDRSWRLNFSL